MYEIIQENCCWLPVFACFFLSGIFVGSLYVWDSKHDRNHSSTIKKRFCSVFVVILISPFVVKLFLTSSYLKTFSIFEILGFRWPGLISALSLPLLHTAVLFLGPLYMNFFSNESFVWEYYCNIDIWLNTFKNLIWLRNVVVGPLAEEFSFRACMIPLLVQCLSHNNAIMVCSLFFGLAHVHHIIERYKAGDPVNILLVRVLIQFTYTTLFGAYSAFVFLKTGHFIAPFIVHSFCNVMALPDFETIFMYQNPKKIILIFIHVLGVVLWYISMPVLLNHNLYENHVYFNKN